MLVASGAAVPASAQDDTTRQVLRLDVAGGPARAVGSLRRGATLRYVVEGSLTRPIDGAWALGADLTYQRVAAMGDGMTTGGADHVMNEAAMRLTSLLVNAARLLPGAHGGCA